MRVVDHVDGVVLILFCFALILPGILLIVEDLKKKSKNSSCKCKGHK